MKAFIVFGSAGEYSDRQEWPVKGFTNKARAEAFEFERTKWARDFKKRLDEHVLEHEHCDKCFTQPPTYLECPRNEPPPAEDPGFRCSYTGTDYYTVEVEIEVSP